jgi:predicted deacetylase
MRFLLSIHDVWPGNFQVAAGYLARLRSLGARRIGLLVVPAFHGHADMDQSGEFLAWLKAESARGCELFLHGYHHQMIELREGPEYHSGRSAFGRWVNRNLVSQEAEFCGLPRAESERLLDLALAAWRRSGLPLTGFVAPTWYGSPDRETLRARGVEFRETRFRVQRMGDGASRFAPPLAWDLSKGKRGAVLFGGKFWLRTALLFPVIKVAIHPGDLDGPETLATLESVFRLGANIGYRELFESARGSVAPG